MGGARSVALLTAAGSVALSIAAVPAGAAVPTGHAVSAVNFARIAVAAHRVGRGQLSPDSPITLTGTVRPAAPGPRVLLQRRAAGATVWITIRVALINQRSEFTVTGDTAGPGVERFRVLVPAGGGRPDAISAALVEHVTRTPLLGAPLTGTRGYGHTRPMVIDNGGDPTGRVTHLRWTSWGPARAVGTGYAYDPGTGPTSKAVRRRAIVVAFHLGHCHGSPAYNAVEWYFPHDHQSFDPATYRNTCTGTFHG